MVRTDFSRLLMFMRSSPFWGGLLAFMFAVVCLYFSRVLLRVDRPLAAIPYMMPLQMKHFTFGMKEQIADVLWLRSVQDFDYCENNTAPQMCTQEGWLFRMLDMIGELSPSFRMPMATGPLALTVIVNDLKGAGLLFDRAVKNFPKDWPILSRAAYHALYEEQDKEKAARLMRQAADSGAPGWYYMLATTLYSESGKITVAEALMEQLATDPKTDPKLLEAMAKRLKELKKSAQSQPASR